MIELEVSLLASISRAKIGNGFLECFCSRDLTAIVRHNLEQRKLNTCLSWQHHICRIPRFCRINDFLDDLGYLVHRARKRVDTVAPFLAQNFRKAFYGRRFPLSGMRSFINVEARSLPEAYLDLYLRLGEKGKWGQKESYSVGKKVDRIFECESRVAISNVLQEPIVSFAFPGLEDLPTYVGDVLLGSKDYIIGAGYDYTYHDRIFHRVGGPGGQIAYVIRKLKDTYFSNRAQITTWIPELDSRIDGPPCFQRGWFKVEDGTLHFETDWRSREFVYAWYENIIGMAGLAMLVRDCLRDYSGLELSDEIRYVDKCNSLHVYERDYDDFERTLSTIRQRNGNVDAWNSTDSKSISIFGGKALFSSVKEAKQSIFDPVFEKREK